MGDLGGGAEAACGDRGDVGVALGVWDVGVSLHRHEARRDRVTVIPSAASSRAQARVSPICAAFDAA